MEVVRQGSCSDHSRNSTACWVTSNSRINRKPLDLMSSITEGAPWYSVPGQAQEQLRLQALQPTKPAEVMDFMTQKKKTAMQREGTCHATIAYKQGEDGVQEAIVLVDSLKIHSKVQDFHKGCRVHADIVRDGLLDTNVFVGCALLNMYAKCGDLERAQEVFDELPTRNIAVWNALITGYTQHGRCEDALICYERMRREGVFPNAVTFAGVLSACGSSRASQKGRDVHACIVKEGLLEADTVLANALIDMYAKCGALAEAQRVLDELRSPDAISYTSLLVGYAQHSRSKEVFDCYERMQLEGLDPNEITFAGILKACGSAGARDKGQEIHAQITIAGLLETGVFLGTAVLDMYSNCGSMAEAQDVFDELLVHDVVAWNALIGGYTERELGETALDCFTQMQEEGLSPNAVTFACVLKACGDVGALDTGRGIYGQVVKVGVSDRDLVCAGLVDMYANCGMIEDAKDVLDRLPNPSIVSESALMVGFSQLGKDEEMLAQLERMIGAGKKPDCVSVTIVLNGCSHEGLVDKGQGYLETFSGHFDMLPTLEHLTCMVDLFGRAGRFDTAVATILGMPFSANLTLWRTLLGACRKWENLELGTWAFEKAVQFDERNAEAYACMRNIYA